MLRLRDEVAYGMRWHGLTGLREDSGKQTNRSFQFAEHDLLLE